MTVKTIDTAPIDGQKPGTSGLRKKTRIFMEAPFLHNYVQAIFDSISVAGKTLVVGGDGRFFNDSAIQIIIRMAAANGAERLIVGQNGLLSTPAASHLIRLNKTDGGLILSASHNPGGIDEDFGLKYNMPNGGPATNDVTDDIFARTQTITHYKTCDTDDIDLSAIGDRMVDGMTVRIVDPVADYAALMRELFDFELISDHFKSGFRFCFDAMHAVTGPYATAIFEDILGAPKGSVINGTPLPDFGGGHPDPNPVWAHELVTMMSGPDAPDFGAASDGDGDRNMVMGADQYISPSDSLALLVEHAALVPAFAGGLSGVARSMPTSGAVDRVASAKGLATYETPTGWKYFGTLLDAGKVSICGEESAGTGGDHIREKDGIWAVLLWLNILAKTKTYPNELMKDMWRTHGRVYYSRHDFEAIPLDSGQAIMDGLRAKLGDISSPPTGADEFSYTDPVDGSSTSGQGMRVFAGDTGRFVYRLSGTGTEGATLRLYLEAVETDPSKMDQDPQVALAPLIKDAMQRGRITELTGRTEPDVIT